VYPVAVIVPDVDVLIDWAKIELNNNASLIELCEDKVNYCEHCNYNRLP